MNGKYVLKFAGTLLCLLVAIAIFAEVFSFKFKDGIFDMQKFYELPPDSVDVLVLGSSHAFMDINPAVLYEDYGITAFNLCGSRQPMWNTYYYLVEALKTQSPKVIVLDTYMLEQDPDYFSDGQFDSNVIKNVYGMRWSRTKIDALRVSVPRERRAEFFLSYIQYHNRYRDIVKKDFADGEDGIWDADSKGAIIGYGQVEFVPFDAAGVTSQRPLWPKVEEYYRKIIELAQEKGIPLYIVTAPYPKIDAKAQEYFNTGAAIAEEYGVPFENFNQNPGVIGLDYRHDFCDIDHMNSDGNRKYSHFLGGLLQRMFSLPDHRGDPAYQTWADNSLYMKRVILRSKLLGCRDSESMGRLLRDDDYIVFLCTGGSSSVEDAGFQPFFRGFGMKPSGGKGVWAIDGGQVKKELSGSSSGTEYLSRDGHDIFLEYHSPGAACKISCDRKEYRKTADGLHVMVYSKTMKDVAYAFDIGPGTGYQCHGTDPFPL